LLRLASLRLVWAISRNSQAALAGRGALNRVAGTAPTTAGVRKQVDVVRTQTTRCTHLYSYRGDVALVMRKRRNLCVLFTQCAQTESARAFWAGKLTMTTP